MNDAIHPHDELAELAAGVLDGRTRAAVLAHTESCPGCARTLEELSAVADRLLEAGGEAEPPLGFESRVVSSMRAEGPAAVVPAAVVPITAARAGATRRRPAAFHRIVLGAAAAVVAAGLVVVGFSLHRQPASDHTTASSQYHHVVTTALLTSDHRNVGSAYLSAGPPTWLFMSVHGVSTRGTVRCWVTDRSGHTYLVGSFMITSNGEGAWGASIPASATPVVAAQVTTASGAVIARTTLG